MIFVSLHFSYSHQFFFLSLWCLICGPFHCHLLVCYCPDAGTFISSLSLHASCICHPSNSLLFIFSLFLFTVYSVLSSCNHLLGHYNEQVLLYAVHVMNIYNVLWLNKGTIQAFGGFFFRLVIHASCYLFLSWPPLLFMLLFFCLLQLLLNFILSPLSLTDVPFTFSVVFLCFFSWNIPVLFCLPFSRSIFLHNFHLYTPSRIIYCPWVFFPFIPDILVISSCLSLSSRIFHLSIHCPFPILHSIPRFI